MVLGMMLRESNRMVSETIVMVFFLKLEKSCACDLRHRENITVRNMIMAFFKRKEKINTGNKTQNYDNYCISEVIPVLNVPNACFVDVCLIQFR